MIVSWIALSNILLRLLRITYRRLWLAPRLLVYYATNGERPVINIAKRNERGAASNTAIRLSPTHETRRGNWPWFLLALFTTKVQVQVVTGFDRTVMAIPFLCSRDNLKYFLVSWARTSSCCLRSRHNYINQGKRTVTSLKICPYPYALAGKQSNVQIDTNSARCHKNWSDPHGDRSSKLKRYSAAFSFYTIPLWSSLYLYIMLLSKFSLPSV